MSVLCALDKLCCYFFSQNWLVSPLLCSLSLIADLCPVLYSALVCSKPTPSGSLIGQYRQGCSNLQPHHNMVVETFSLEEEAPNKSVLMALSSIYVHHVLLN